jgi:hypothetical protein
MVWEYVCAKFGEFEWIWSSGGMILIGENWRTQRNTCPSATLSTTNPTWTVLGMNLGLCHEKPVTNRVSYGTARLLWFNHVWILCSQCFEKNFVVTDYCFPSHFWSYRYLSYILLWQLVKRRNQWVCRILNEESVIIAFHLLH